MNLGGFEALARVSRRLKGPYAATMLGVFAIGSCLLYLIASAGAGYAAAQEARFGQPIMALLLGILAIALLVWDAKVFRKTIQIITKIWRRIPIS